MCVSKIIENGSVSIRRRAIGRREAISVLRRFAFFLFLNDESPRPLGTASPDFQGSRMGGWYRPSLSPIFKFLSCRGARVKIVPNVKVPKNGLRHFSSGRGAVYREYLFSCAESGKNWCPFTSGIPSRIKPCRVLCDILAGGDNFRGVKLFWLFIEHGQNVLPIEFNMDRGIPSPRSYLWNVGHLPDDVGSDRKPPRKCQRTGNGRRREVGQNGLSSKMMTSFDRKSPGRGNFLQYRWIFSVVYRPICEKSSLP